MFSKLYQFNLKQKMKQSINDLTKSINDLTEVIKKLSNSENNKPIQNLSYVDKPNVEFSNKIKTLSEETKHEDNLTETKKITKSELREFAKEKIQRGTPRDVIKGVIFEFVGKGNSIMDLKESDIEKCYSEIDKL